ncbi:hypothetical protein EYC84_000427 [Monilinia fructicola]|uniref:Uncharacterized protein n=1 Tax=Monilinia fructicola TaxID=38448 RepID=A0A5M9JTF0_MONFR|nr:hypothetical protein EYC84_000427 [Monilinia fructicola]
MGWDGIEWNGMEWRNSMHFSPNAGTFLFLHVWDETRLGLMSSSNTSNGHCTPCEISSCAPCINLMICDNLECSPVWIR